MWECLPTRSIKDRPYIFTPVPRRLLSWFSKDSFWTSSTENESSTFIFRLWTRKLTIIDRQIFIHFFCEKRLFPIIQIYIKPYVDCSNIFKFLHLPSMSKLLDYFPRGGYYTEKNYSFWITNFWFLYSIPFFFVSAKF